MSSALKARGPRAAASKAATGAIGKAVAKVAKTGTAIEVVGSTADWFEKGGRNRKRAYAEVFKADPLRRIEVIKRGVPAHFVIGVADDLHVTKERLTKSLGLPASTISRKVKSRQNLTTDQAERVIGLSKLVGQVQTMVEQSGNPEGFDAAEWVGRWIERPNPALGGLPPANFLDTGEGQEIVSGLLSKMLSGAIA